jgi:hypothetical protein
MSTLNFTDFPGNPFATAKALRQSALKWQLLALEAQAKAIEAIAAEHHISLSDLEFETLVDRTRDLVTSANELAREAETTPTNELLPRIVALREASEDLRVDVARFVRTADQRAHFRLTSLLPVLFDITKPGEDALKPNDTEENAHIINDAEKLAVASGARCYRAESEQHGTFALQVNSICDLALELVMSAASDYAKKGD